MSAIVQPAFMSGSITFWCVAARMSADSAMKWTPQKTMKSASGSRGRELGELEGVAGEVRVADDLVPLVVVAQHDEALPERLLGRGDPLLRLRRGRRP